LPTPEQTGIPPAHEVFPAWQRLPPGLHGMPSAHATHFELWQIGVAGGHIVQLGPHAMLSLVVSTQAFPQSVRPPLHENVHPFDAEQMGVALGGAVPHAAQRPPQQMPEEHAVPSVTSPVSMQTG
jgi:hypothetical protein